MADSKITALAALTAADPANDMVPIVDVSDNSMAASGTTKRISINNILACSPSATLASLNVTGSSIPANGLYLPTTNTLEFSANSLAQYRIAPLGVFSWYDGAGGTRMTLNSTGLGVGGSPAASKLEVYSSNTGTSGLAEANALKVENNNATVGNASGLFLSQSGNAGCGVAAIATSRTGGSRASDLTLYYYNQSTSSSPIEGLRLNSSGNVGIGVAPSATDSTYYQALEITRVGQGLTGAKNALTSSPNSWLSNNSYATYSAGIVWKYAVSQPAAQYRLVDAAHQWYNAPSGTAGNPITFTQAMTLDASGNLLVGTTTNGGNGVSIRPSTSSPNAVLVGSDTSGGTAWQMYSTGTSSSRFYVTWAGTINAVNTTIAAISDARLKENVQDIDVGLGAILALKPRKFDWKAGKGKDIKGDRGFIAQEFEQVFPQLVDEWADPAPEGEAPYKSVRQDLIPVLVKAIQELAAEVNALKNA